MNNSFKIFLATAILVFGFVQETLAQQYLWRYRTHASDCTSLTDGKPTDLCKETNTGKIYVCSPSAGDCDTSTEWVLVSQGWIDGGTNVYQATTTDNVGIGTTTPSGTLEIVKVTNVQPLMVSATPTGDGDTLIVTSYGNVGIGTTSPQFQLDIVNSNANYTGIQIKNPDSTGLSKFEAVNDLGNVGAFLCTGSADTFPNVCGFLTTAGIKTYIGEQNGNLNMTIDGVNGNVGIGTVEPRSMLGVGTVSQFIVNSNGNVGIGTFSTTKNALTIMSGNVGIGTWGNGATIMIGGAAVAQAGSPGKMVCLAKASSGAACLGYCTISVKSGSGSCICTCF